MRIASRVRLVKFDFENNIQAPYTHTHTHTHEPDLEKGFKEYSKERRLVSKRN
jgi:hypothetical protein